MRAHPQMWTKKCARLILDIAYFPEETAYLGLHHTRPQPTRVLGGVGCVAPTTQYPHKNRHGLRAVQRPRAGRAALGQQGPARAAHATRSAQRTCSTDTARRDSIRSAASRGPECVVIATVNARVVGFNSAPAWLEFPRQEPRWAGHPSTRAERPGEVSLPMMSQGILQSLYRYKNWPVPGPGLMEDRWGTGSSSSGGLFASRAARCRVLCRLRQELAGLPD